MEGSRGMEGRVWLLLEKRKTAYEVRLSVVGSEMYMRDGAPSWLEQGADVGTRSGNG